MTTKLFGTKVPRVEDDRLLRGAGGYLDDLFVDPAARGQRHVARHDLDRFFGTWTKEEADASASFQRLPVHRLLIWGLQHGLQHDVLRRLLIGGAGINHRCSHHHG